VTSAHENFGCPAFSYSHMAIELSFLSQVTSNSLPCYYLFNVTVFCAAAFNVTVFCAPGTKLQLSRIVYQPMQLCFC